MTLFIDRAEVSVPISAALRSGFFNAPARIARTGIQIYSGGELTGGDGVDPEAARGEVKDLVDEVRRELPRARDVEPIVTDIDFENTPLMLVNMVAPEGFDRRSLKELAEILLRLTGSNLPINYKERSQATLVRNRIGSPDRAGSEIGFVARKDLEDGLRELIEWRATHKAEVAVRRRRAAG